MPESYVNFIILCDCQKNIMFQQSNELISSSVSFLFPAHQQSNIWKDYVLLYQLPVLRDIVKCTL